MFYKGLLGILLAALAGSGCGGANTPSDTTPASSTSTDTPPPASDTSTKADAPAETTDETAPVAEESADTKAEAAPQPAPSEPAAAAPKKQPVEVKEASAARITDKHIVISGKILFETGKAKLKPVSFDVLDDVVFAMQKHPEIIKIQVAGHTDSDGNANANKRLSKRRAQSVMKYLIREGVERDRVSAIGVGEDVPIASNDTEEGKEKNRRVEFVIVERAKVHAVTHHTSTQNAGQVDSRVATDDETEEMIKKKGLDKKPF